MSRDRLLVFDVGMTHVKSVLFDLDGTIADAAVTGYPTIRAAGDRVEQDPEAWWDSIVACTRALWLREPAARNTVVGIGVTGHMHALVCAGDGLDAIGAALVLGDRRADPQARRLTAEVGASEIYRQTGALMDASMPAAKLRWLRDVEPDRWKATRAFLGCKDFVRYRLTGDLATEPIDACATSLFDITSGTWSDTMLAATGVDEARLPALRMPEEIAGRLRADAASALGLPEGIPVVIGAGDDIEVLGNGLLDAGGCLEHVGTTGSILAVAGTMTPDPVLAVELYPHAVPGRWVLGGSMTMAGAAIAWAADALGYGDVRESLAVLRLPVLVHHPVPTFLPHLAGERVPNRVPGAQGAWIGIEPWTTRADLMRAVFEGVAFALRAVLERVDALAGAAPRLTVSEARDADVNWLRLRASVYGRPLATLATSEPTALGLMAVLAAGVGVYPSVAAATRAVARVTGEIAPDPAQQEHLGRRYERFVDVSGSLAPLWDVSSAP